MGRYLIRRGIVSVVTIIVISMVVFGIIKQAPGDPYAQFANNPNVPPERRAELRASLGLDEPVLVQYASWGRNFLQGDWGDCFTQCENVQDYVVGRIPVTLAVIGSSFIVSILIAIPLGVLSAFKQYSLFDQFATTLAFIGFSVPTFFTGIVLIFIFSVQLQGTAFELPFVYDRQVNGFVGNFKQSIMPIMVLGLFSGAFLTRFVRASMLEVLNQDYVRTARAKGLREQSIVIFHAMRNAMIPVITIIALQIPGIFGGAIITEQIFRVPGIGSALVEAIRAADHPVAMAITFMVAILVVVFNVVADVLYAVMDPRIKLT